MENNTDNKDNCNCNNEFRTEICPVHDKDIDLNNDILTDNDIMNNGRLMQTNPAIAFLCKKCNQPVLNYYKYCAECGQRVVIRSRILTDSINKAIKMQRRGQEQGSK